MKLKRVWVRNYAEFRRTFEDDAEAEQVLKNLNLEILEQIIAKHHIELSLSAAYDDWGDALFDVISVKVLPSQEVIIEVNYTGTVK